MDQDERALPREQWREFFDGLMRDHEGHAVTIEVVSPDLGDQIEADRLPLELLAYDEADDTFIVAVGGRDPEDHVVLRHMVEHPTQISAVSLSADVPWAVDVIGPDGTQSIVTLHRPPMEPPSD